MRRTPHYLLKFNQGGDFLRASEDLERATIIDNQLDDLARITGNGVLTGWNVSKATDTIPSAGDLEILVSPGTGIISKVVHRTLSNKKDTVFDEIETLVYMRSTMFSGSGGFPIEIEGPSSGSSFAMFVDTTAPSAPTGFAGTSVAFDEINLEWDANSEDDFANYRIERDTNSSFSGAVIIGEPTTNGSIPGSPFADAGLDGNTDYYYRISAFDRSGNQSSFAYIVDPGPGPDPITTLGDERTPPDISNLMLLGGNVSAGVLGGAIAIAFGGSQTDNLLSYKITLEMLNADGSVDTTPSYSTYDGITTGALAPGAESLSETYQLTGLPVNRKYRITVQARAISDDGTTPPGNLSAGISGDIFVSSPSAPLDVLNPLTTPVAGGVSIDWAASASASSPDGVPVVGQKTNYRITPIVDGIERSPIDAGLISRPTAKVVFSYGTQAGQVPLVDDVKYLFKIVTMDGFGNSSGGVFVKGTTTDLTAPRNPRALVAVAGDEVVGISWHHSTSEDVVGYNVAYNDGSGYTPDVVLEYVDQYEITGLDNDTEITIRVRARDDAGNLSTGVTVLATPVEDTTPPAIPLFVKASPQDSQVKVSWGKNTEEDFDHYVVLRQTVANPLSTAPNRELTVLAEETMDLGVFTEFTDFGLDNDQVYAYSVKAVDTRGNESDFSANFLVAPSEGLNTGDDRLDAPTNLVATFNSTTGEIDLTWDFSFPGMVFNISTQEYEYPVGNGPTSFNIYRSEDPLGGYQLVDSVGAGVREYSDGALVDGVTYYYVVSAVRDNAVVLVDTGSVAPSNSVLLARVVSDGGQIVSITHDKRIVENIESTIEEETISRLLLHRHAAAPTNSAEVVALASLPMREASDLVEVCFAEGKFTCATDPAHASYYEEALVDSMEDVATQSVSIPDTVRFDSAADRAAYIAQFSSSLNVVTSYSKEVNFAEYDTGTAWLIDPVVLVGNIPFVGDFQVLVDGERPSTTFSIDHDKNIIVFDSPLAAGSEVTLDGMGLTYYIPAKMDNRYRGFSILLDGEESTSLRVDEVGQVVSFESAIADGVVVSAKIEPVNPEFDPRAGARQVSLAPDIVLTDFTRTGFGVYTSESGAFDSTDTVFVLVDGVRTSLDHYVDFENKSIVFSTPPPVSSLVSLEVRNREEVQGELPAKKVGDLDGSQVKSGTLLEAQLPQLSHNGRMMELASPICKELSTTNRYDFQADVGGVGTGTTPYAIFQFDDGNFAMGTSSGFLRTYFIPGLLLAAGDDASVVSSLPLGVGLNFGMDDIVEVADEAKTSSGRVHGRLRLDSVTFLDSSTGSIDIEDPSVCIMGDGKVFISGGRDGLSKCYLYNPLSQATAEVSSMSQGRFQHTCTLMGDGKVIVTGGVSGVPSQCGCFTDSEAAALPFDPAYSDGIMGSFFLSSCEIFDPTSGPNGGWSSMPDMSSKRTMHAAVLVNPLEPTSPLIVAGGTFSRSTSPSTFEKSGTDCEDGESQWCDPDFEKVVLNSAESLFAGTWATISPMTYAAEACGGLSDTSTIVVNTERARETYSISTGSWTANKAQGCLQQTTDFVDDSVLDGPIKQFMRAQDGRLLCVTRNSVFASKNDGRSWIKMSGLEAVGCVHRIAQASNGTLFAATDLGVYEITSDIIAQDTWFQGGLIGSGTTETFDLQPVDGSNYGSVMLAGTEIGIFSTSDDGETWTQVAELDDVRNVELAHDDIVYATAGQDLYVSLMGGQSGSWSKVGTYDFIDPGAKLVIRWPLDMFIGTGTGLYSSQDGQSFSRFSLDRNLDERANNVHMLEAIGGDILVGYDNVAYAIDPNGATAIMAEFVGIVPTVMVNGEEARNGFRYDTSSNRVIFEVKRLVGDVVVATANYALYQLDGGEWYTHNPNAPIRVYVNFVLQDDGTFSYDARLGRVAFNDALDKIDAVRVGLSQTTLKNGGEYFHSELEDKLEREKGGLALSMGRDHVGNLLQFGLGVEHNFLERGIERNQYYCLNESLVDRSFNSFLSQAEFHILGRKEFDRFNSTIDYSTESKQSDIGFSAFAPTSKIEFSLSELWIGTESGIFVLDPTADFAISAVVSVGTGDNPIRDLAMIAGEVHAVTRQGIFKVTGDGVDKTIERNPGGGLPSQVFCLTSLNNRAIAGTSDGIYTSTSDDDPPYGVWFRASHLPKAQQFEVELDGPVACLAADNGLAVAAIGRDIFTSFDGLVWRRAFSFPHEADPTDNVVINRMAFFGGKLFLVTNKGIYGDNASIRSDEVQFVLEKINGTTDGNDLHMNDAFPSDEALYAVGESTYVYKLQNGLWTRSAVTGVVAMQLFVVTSTGSNVAMSNNQIFVE